MGKGTLCLGFLAGSLLAAACSAPGPGEFGNDIEVSYEDSELDKVTFEEDDPPGSSDYVKVERKRTGARFAFGGESARGFFQIFGEEWKAGSARGLDVFGAGGGVMGAPVVSEVNQDLVLIIPYRADISLAFGSDSVGPVDRALGYAEFHGDVGFGLDWLGLRPSIGLAISSLGGAYVLDPGGGDQDYTLSGFNAGFFLDILYKHPDFPLYGHLRFLTGDYSGTVIGIGGKF